MTAQELATLHAAAFSATRAWSKDEFATLLNQSGALAIGTPECCVLMRVIVDEAEILTLATHPANRRQGLAQDTLHQTEALAAARGATSVILEVAEDNAAAINLYVKANYRQVGRRPGYYLPKDGSPIAALVMRKSLPAT